MKEKDDQLIVRLMSGEYKYDDVLELYDRLDSDKDNKELVTILEWLTVQNEETSGYPIENIMENYHARKRFKCGLRTLMGCVAVLATLLVLSLTNVIGNPETLVKHISGDAISRIELPDGTKVTMAKNSIIEHPETFKGSQRRVKLAGKAFFDVAHDTSKPFFVDTKDASVMVTGTRFDMTNNIEDKIVSATLVEGSIRFVGKNESVDMIPGEQVVFNKETKMLTRSKVDVNKETLWLEDIHRYRSVTLSALAEDLSILFGYTIILDPELKDVILSGAFGSDYSLTDVLEILENCLNIEYKISNDAVFIHKSI